MIELYKPDMYVKNIYCVDYKKLKSCGIKCILLDLDNTIVPVYMKKPSRKNKDFVEKLKEMGFKVIIFSNSGKKRLTPFKTILEVDCSPLSGKPFSKKFKTVINEYKFSESEIVIIGDQIPTDIYGGNKIGIFTILVTPISKREPIWTKINRLYEKSIINKLSRKKLFKKGEYYE